MIIFKKVIFLEKNVKKRLLKFAYRIIMELQEVITKVSGVIK